MECCPKLVSSPDPNETNPKQGQIQDFQKGGGGHILIERAISYHFSQKGCITCVHHRYTWSSAPRRAGNSLGTRLYRIMVGVAT